MKAEVSIYIEDSLQIIIEMGQQPAYDLQDGN